MRKVFAWLLMFLGAFLIVTTILALVWLPGAVKRTPLNTDSYTYLTGSADKLNPATGEVEPALPVKVLSRTKVDDKKSDGSVIVFLNTTCANIDEDGPDDCLTDDDPRLITNAIDVFATDRNTGEAVNDPEYLPADAETHEGLQNKFPFGTQQESYQFWDGLLGQTVPAEYVGIKDIDGLETYEFHILIDEVPATVIGDVAGIYSMDKTMWIEPNSGAIIDQSQHDVRTLEDGSTILDMSISFTDETVAANVEDGKSNSNLLSAVTTTVPIAAGILGVLAILGGFLLMRRRDADEAEVEDRETVDA